MDCANGVGAPIAKKFAYYLGEMMPLVLHNTDITTPGSLNNNCGADYVKTTQRPPPSLNGLLKKGQRGCSLDGDADRLMYYYVDEQNYFQLLDGDKIAALVAAFIVDLVKLAGLANSIRVGVVQTAYANGASTRYLSEASGNSKADCVKANGKLLAPACSMRPDWRQASSPCGGAIQHWRVLRGQWARDRPFLPIHFGETGVP